MSYSYTNGDGVSVLLVTEPDGATEPVSNLDDAVRQVKAYLNDPISGPQATVEATIPPGSLMMFAGSSAPSGWLICDGSQRTDGATTAADLFAAIGTTFGGTGAADFNLPDFRGRVPVGAGSGAGLSARTRGDEFGEEDHLLTGAESGEAGHTHNIELGTTNDNWDQGQIQSTDTVGTGPDYVLTTPAADAAEAHNNMPPALVVNYIIKV